MKRDLMKTAGTWEDVPRRYIPTWSELISVYEITHEDMAEAIGLAFRFGFQLGRKCEERHRKKGKKPLKV